MRASTISKLGGVLEAIPACIRWIAEEARGIKGDNSACRTLIRPEMLVKIQWPELASPDDLERLSEYFNLILDEEPPGSYLTARAKEILDTNKPPPQTIAELLPFLKTIIRVHAAQLTDKFDFEWLERGLKMMLDIAIGGARCGYNEETKRKDLAHYAWYKKNCSVNEVSMLKILAEMMFRVFPGPDDVDPAKTAALTELWNPLWRAARGLNEVRSLVDRLVLLRMRPDRKRFQSREAGLASRIALLIGKIRGNLPPGYTLESINETPEDKKKRKAAGKTADAAFYLVELKREVIRIIGSYDRFAKELRDEKEVQKAIEDIQYCEGKFDNAIEKAQGSLAYLRWLKNHPRLQRRFKETILDSSNPEKIVAWIHELPQEVAQLLVLATTGGDLNRPARFGHLVLFDSLGPSLDVQAFEEILYLCPQGASAPCAKMRQ